MLNIYEVTVKGSLSSYTFQVIDTGIWGVWYQFNELIATVDFPKVGKTVLEINIKEVSPLYT